MVHFIRNVFGNDGEFFKRLHGIVNVQIFFLCKTYLPLKYEQFEKLWTILIVFAQKYYLATQEHDDDNLIFLTIIMVIYFPLKLS